MKRILLLLAVASAFVAWKYEEHRRVQIAHWSTHRTELERVPSVLDFFFSSALPDKSQPKRLQFTCSATAIGPHALLTARHCEGDFPDIKIDGKPAHIDKIIYDTSDHSIYLLSGITFPYWVSMSSLPLEQGDDVFMWGNPDKHRDFLRRGYVSSVANNDEGGTYSVLDLNGFYGDSGSAVFNERGEIVSVVSFIDLDETDESDAVIKTMGAFDLGFRQSDYERARRY